MENHAIYSQLYLDYSNPYLFYPPAHSPSIPLPQHPHTPPHTPMPIPALLLDLIKRAQQQPQIVRDAVCRRVLGAIVQVAAQRAETHY